MVLNNVLFFSFPASFKYVFFLWFSDVAESSSVVFFRGWGVLGHDAFIC